MAESKSGLLYILKYLWQNTDAEHYATTADILTFLKGNGVSCDRKTIPSDIQKLCDMGMDIEEERSRENRYFLSSHLFTLSSLLLRSEAETEEMYDLAARSRHTVSAELHHAISCLKPKQLDLLFKMQKLPAALTAGSLIFTHGLLDCFLILSVQYEKNYQCVS